MCVLVSIVYCFCPLILAMISPCAKWNTSGITLVGEREGGISGGLDDSLFYPNSIFFHKNSNTLYVADVGGTLAFPLNGSTTAGINVANYSGIAVIYVDDDEDGPILYAAVNDIHVCRIEKWKYGASNGIQVGYELRYCTGIWVDQEKNIYVSDFFRHRVIKWSVETNTTTIVAGRTDESGSTAKHLAYPSDIHVDRTGNAVYVADRGNSRIQRWTKGAQEGVTVAGSSTNIGNNDNTWITPNAIWFDDETSVIYIADGTYSRIQRWISNTSIGHTIASGFGMYIQIFISTKQTLVLVVFNYIELSMLLYYQKT
ncbi:unnamed protein product [Rotaria sp. Silwood1]|nr:unnamed protein product [Rotaria sp. Silwood1]